MFAALVLIIDDALGCCGATMNPMRSILKNLRFIVIKKSTTLLSSHVGSALK
jgi:hypothetical protein